MTNDKIQKALEQNDRRGEIAITVIQIIFAIAILCLHIFSALRNDWQSFSTLTTLITTTLILSSIIRAYFAGKKPLSNKLAYLLTVIDGLLIFMLIVSYSYAYDLPFESVFKTPSIIFLLVFTCVRAVRIDVWSILVAAFTVTISWLCLLLFSIHSGAKLTTSYVEYINSTKLMIGANIEFMIGYAAIVTVLCMVAVYARRLLASSAHVDDLAEAFKIAEGSLKRIQSILHSTSDGVIILDARGVIKHTNPALDAMFGYSHKELLDQSVALLMSKGDADLFRQDIEYFARHGESRLVGQPFESVGQCKNDETFPIEVAINKLEGSDELSFVGFVRDIRDRKKALAQEKNALAQFEDAVQSALDAIIVIDARDRIISFNPAAEEIFGYRAEEAIGRKMANLIIPEKYREAHIAGMLHFLKTGEGPVLGNRIEITGIRKSGEEFDLELAVRNIDSPLGLIFIGYARDITSRKAAEQELVTAKENAEVANKAKARFLAMMSHEIRTPLSGLLGILDLLQDTKLSEEQKKQLNIANQSGTSLMSIINDILDFSKLDADRLEIKHHAFNVEQIITNVSSLVKASAYNKNVELIPSVSSNVPENLIGDQHRISQVLINLVSNAIKFTNAGTVEILVDNIGSKAEPSIRFMVKDTGLGIPEEKQGQLFTEFATLDREYSSKFGGTGLGLAISKALVEAMDGSIAFESNYGFGSNFWFDLPLAEGQLEQNEQAKNTIQIVSQNHDAPLKVLVAEDNETNQMIISVILKRLGCETKIVSDGEQAFREAQEHIYDIIFMDVSMPNMDGLEATQKIRTLPGDHSKAKIIALTAYTQEEDKLKVYEAGMDAFLSKPVFRNDIASIINKVHEPHESSNKANEAEPEPSTSPLDNNILADITDGMDDNEIAELFTMFARDLRRHLGNAETAIKSNDTELLERSSHGLKGLSGVFGASDLLASAATVNEHCLNGNINISHAKHMITQCDFVLSWVQSNHLGQSTEFDHKSRN